MADLKTQMDQHFAEFAKHYEEGTIKEGMKDWYTADCKVIGPGYEKPLEGNQNEELVKEWEKRKKVGGQAVSIHQDEILDLGDTAVERSHFEFTKPDGTNAVTGHCVQVWKKVDGKWRVYITVYTDCNSPV